MTAVKRGPMTAVKRGPHTAVKRGPMTVTRRFAPRFRPGGTVDARSLGLSRLGTVGDEHGSMSVSSLVGFTLFVIPSLMFVLAIPPWEAGTADARNAAHDAVLALASTPDWSVAELDASQEIEYAESGYGVPLTASFGCDGSITYCDVVCLPGGATVTAAVSVTIPVGNVPGVVEHYASVGFTATYTATVDQYAADNGCD
jgi:hypothetical protein